MDTTVYLSSKELEAGMEHIRHSPRDEGVVKMIVRRPRVDERELLDEAELNLTDGLVGDNWQSRGSTSTHNGSANIDAQITLMNARTIALLAQDETQWSSLAGNQYKSDSSRYHPRWLCREKALNSIR